MYKETKFYLDILKKMCENKKTPEEILNYINTFDKKLRLELFTNELKHFSKDVEFIIGKGNTEGKIMFIYEKPSETYSKTGKDDVVGGIIESLCNNAAERINPIFDKENIYETFFIKNAGFKHDGFYINAIKEEISLIHPDIVICFGKNLCEYIIHPEYDLEDKTIYNDGPKYIGCANIYDINKDNALNIKTNIWNKFNLFQSNQNN